MKGKGFVDGGARGNPGPAGAGAVLLGARPLTISKYLGKATNNVAEYTALVLLLRKAVEQGYGELEIFADSELMVRQINGQYKVKDEKLRGLYFQAAELIAKLQKFSLTHVPRAQNKEADKLVNEAIDRGC
ncbi:ribonuclease HI [Candidatus Termititenax aidoneus]|uniref:Ribonuclease HI n=1 Tax=Termititenax aidoneus TaxID=2218524 RepID=A0A388TCZ7_TERA1|nr:ribonuclease HI [Candidatus Termititenax aidoneus]